MNRISYSIVGEMLCTIFGRGKIMEKEKSENLKYTVRNFSVDLKHEFKKKYIIKIRCYI